jgi:hypothetical protein
MIENYTWAELAAWHVQAVAVAKAMAKAKSGF